MAERTRLESVHGRKIIVGSNPTLSALSEIKVRPVIRQGAISNDMANLAPSARELTKSRPTRSTFGFTPNNPSAVRILRVF